MPYFAPNQNVFKNCWSFLGRVTMAIRAKRLQVQVLQKNLLTIVMYYYNNHSTMSSCRLQCRHSYFKKIGQKFHKQCFEERGGNQIISFKKRKIVQTNCLGYEVIYVSQQKIIFAHTKFCTNTVECHFHGTDNGQIFFSSYLTCPSLP